MDNSVVFSRQTCSVVNPISGLKIRLIAGEAWASNDPFVQLRSDLFRTMPLSLRRTEPEGVCDIPVEAAIAVPGVKRQVKRG
jgi:hypothetical protein